MWEEESQALRHCQMSLDQGVDRLKVIQIDLLFLTSCTPFLMMVGMVIISLDLKGLRREMLHTTFWCMLKL